MTGDGAYDTQPVHAAVMQRNATPSMPPRKNARVRKGEALRTAMRRWPHAGTSVENSGRAGAVTTGAAWWRPI